MRSALPSALLVCFIECHIKIIWTVFTVSVNTNKMSLFVCLFVSQRNRHANCRAMKPTTAKVGRRVAGGADLSKGKLMTCETLLRWSLDSVSTTSDEMPRLLSCSLHHNCLGP